MRKIFFILIWILAAVPAGAQTAEVKRLDLRQVLEIASQRSPEVSAAGERVKQAAARYGASYSAYLPQLTLSASESRQTRNLKANGIEFPMQPDVVGPFNSFDARMTYTQQIFDWETVERIRAASAARDYFDAERDRIRQDVMALAAVLYLDAKRAKEKLAVQRMLVYERSQNSELAKIRLAAGHASELESDSALNSASDAEYQWGRMKMDADQKRLDLLTLIGMPLDTPVEFAADEWSGAFDSGLKNTAAEISGTPEMRAAEAKVRQAKAQKRGALSEWLPKAAAEMDIGKSGSEPSDARRTYTVGGKISWPVLEGGRSFFYARESQSAQREAEVLKNHLRDQKAADAQLAEENVRLMEKWAALRAEESKVADRESRIAFLKMKSGEGGRQAWLQKLALKRLKRDELEEARTAWATAQIQWCHVLGRMDDLLKGEGDKHEA